MPLDTYDLNSAGRGITHYFLVTRMQIATSVMDFAWFAGSTALLVSLPILIELQRETTVLVLQRQREVETQATYEQAKQMNPGIIDQARGLVAMATGRPLDASAGQ